MKTIYQLQQIAARLRAVRETGSISPEETFGLQADVLEYLADMEQNAEGLGIHKVYASYTEMVADVSAPIGTNGKALRSGQLVAIYDEANTSQLDNGKVYAWEKGKVGVAAWRLMGSLGDTALIQELKAQIRQSQAEGGYYECSTATAEAAKTIAATGYSLRAGGNIRIKMTNANTADAVTLNINGTGAKALFYNGTQASSTNSWEAGEVVEVYYDGTQYFINTDTAQIHDAQKHIDYREPQNSYIDIIGYLGHYYISANGTIAENDRYKVTLPIELHPYETISSLDAITVNATPWIWGYDEQTESYYSLGVEIIGGAVVHSYTNNTHKTIKVVFQLTETNLNEYHRYKIFTNSQIVPYNIWNEENKNIGNGISVGYTSNIGERRPLSLYPSSAYAHTFVPVKKDEVIVVSGLRGQASRPPVAFIDPESQILLGGELIESGNSQISRIGKYTVPADCMCLLQSQGIDNNLIYIYIEGVDEKEYRRRMGEDFENGNLCHKDFGENNAVVFNQDIVGKLYYERDAALHLLHFSDLHADVTNLKSMIAFGKEYGYYIDDILNTGDTVQSTFADGTWDGIKDLEGFGTILSAIGNHDGATDTTPTGWEGVAKTDVYNRYLKPYISNWGVVQPSDAEVNGLCYYYKDYTDKGIRLVVLDSIMSDYTAQTTWLASVLEDARQNSLTVVLAQHTPILAGTQLQSAYTVGEVASGGFYPNTPAIEAVDTFIANGGKFACWIVGHTHFDDMRYLPEHSNQLMICISTAKLQASLRYRRRNSKHQELFNFVSINPTREIIKIVRIGAGLSDVNVLDIIGVRYGNNPQII